MANRRRGKRLIRALMVLSLGGSAFQLSGCDPEVRTALLDGLEQTSQALSTALISAFFLGLQSDNGLL